MLIKESCVISAYKYNNGKISKIATVSYTIKNNGNQDDIVVSKTTGSCNPFDLTIMTGIVGGTIYYTVGSEAKTGYDQIVTQYTNSIPITLTSVVSVYVKNGDQYTNIKSFTYTIYERTLSTPVANNISGSYEPFWLSLNTISGGEILYAVSDKEVTSYDSIGSTYSNQLRIDATQVVSAYVKSGSVISPIIHYSYIISETKLLTPNVSCKSGRYEPFIFSFTELLDGEEVRYDISKVGKSEYIDIRSVYTEPLLIKESCVISAFKKKGSLISDIERYTYTILNTGNSGDIVASKVTGPYNPFDLILKTGIVGGEIYYTVGSEAKTEYRQIVTQYTNPIAITSTSVVSVYVKNGAQYTNIQTFRYTIYEKTLPTPTANVVSGEYEPFWLSLNTIFGGEILYVVSDREVKSYDSILTKYSIPLRIDATQVVSAYVKSGDIISPIVHYTYTIRDVLLDQPSVSKITGDYAPFIFSFTNIDEGDEVRYSIGKTAKSEYFDILSVYKNSLLIKESCVISAYKYNNGKISKIMTVSYIIRNEDGQSDIIMSDGTGSYNPFDLSIATGIVDGEIYYAVGSEAKTVYSQILTRYTIPIPLSSTSVVSVYVKKGDQYTNIQSFTYTIYERTLPTPVANKLSGEYSPFIFNFLSTGNIKYIQSDTPVTSYNRIINTFEKPFIIDKTKYIACYSINENDGIISPIVNYQFTITNTKIPSPVPSKVEGDYFPFLLTLNKSNYYTIKYAISETVINDYSMILNEYVDAINIVKTGYLNCYKIENDLISDILSVKYTISNDLPVIPAIIKPVGSGVDNVISDNTLFSEGISWSDTINGRMLDYVIDMDLNNDSITDISINNGTLNSLSINDELKSKLSVNLTTLKIKVSIKDRSGGLLVDGVYKTYKYFNKKILKSNVSVEILKASRAGNDLFISSLTKVDNKVKGNFIVCDGLYNTKFDQTLQTNISGSIMSLSTSWGVSAGMTAFHVLDSGVNKIYYISNISSTSAGVINQTYINGRNPHVLYYNGNYHLFFINSNNNITEWTLNEMGVKQSEKEVVVNLSLYSTLNSVTQSDTHVAMGVEYFDSGLIKGKTYLFPIDLSTNTQFIDVFSLEQYGYSSNIDASYVSSVWNDDVNNYSFYYKLRALTGSDKKITIDTGEGSSAILGRANDVFYIMYDKMYSGYSEIFITKTDGSMKISEKITDDRKIRNNLNMVSYEKELYGVWLENGIDIAVIRIY
ncbi:MAG: hypothetical protein A2Y29_05035 [Spirochaetes bacterium GWE2_31_10]|nr:MAG: hypothetical protein A2Y29_05035 [Spirochaetes bacterium GWE2_31_10]